MVAPQSEHGMTSYSFFDLIRAEPGSHCFVAPAGSSLVDRAGIGSRGLNHPRSTRLRLETNADDPAGLARRWRGRCLRAGGRFGRAHRLRRGGRSGCGALGLGTGGLAPALLPPELVAPGFLALAPSLLATGLFALRLGILVAVAGGCLRGFLLLRLCIGDADVAFHVLATGTGKRADPCGLLLQVGDQVHGDLRVLGREALPRQVALARLRGSAAQLPVVLAGEATQPAELALRRSDQLGCIRGGLRRGGSGLWRRLLGRGSLLRGSLLRGRRRLRDVRRRLRQQRHHLGTDAIARRLLLQTLEVFPRPSLTGGGLQEGELPVIPAAALVLLLAVGRRGLGPTVLVFALPAGFLFALGGLALGELAGGFVGLEAPLLFLALAGGFAVGGELAGGFLGLEALFLFVAALGGFAFGDELAGGFLGLEAPLLLVAALSGLALLGGFAVGGELACGLLGLEALLLILAALR